jgi:hypothetical protein
MKLLRLIVAACVAATSTLVAAPATAANILTFADNATSCGGSTICSTNGTTGYTLLSSGQAFDLSTVQQWFQIDTDGLNHLATQSMAEPKGGAGAFLVLNDTGALLNTFAITLTGTISSSTPSAVACGGGNYCVNYQIADGAAHLFNTLTISGPACVTNCGTNSANATSGLLTYTWSNTDKTKGLAAGATANLTFASWDHTVYSPAVPEPSTWAMMLMGFGAIGASMRFRRRRIIAPVAA